MPVCSLPAPTLDFVNCTNKDARHSDLQWLKCPEPGRGLQEARLGRYCTNLAISEVSVFIDLLHLRGSASFTIYFLVLYVHRISLCLVNAMAENISLRRRSRQENIELKTPYQTDEKLEVQDVGSSPYTAPNMMSGICSVWGRSKSSR
jgi:hypothetical protein